MYIVFHIELTVKPRSSITENPLICQIFELWRDFLVKKKQQYPECYLPIDKAINVSSITTITLHAGWQVLDAGFLPNSTKSAIQFPKSTMTNC